MLTIRDLLRSSSVKRWHTVAGLNTEQTVGQHSQNVTFIALELLSRLVPKPSMEDQFYVMQYCMYHDTPEVICGDISSPFKKYLYKQIEGFKSAMQELEYQICPALKECEAYFVQRPHLAIICHVADVLDAFHFIKHNVGHDYDHMNLILTKLDTYLTRLYDEGMTVCDQYNWDIINHVQFDMCRGESLINNFEDQLVL